MAQMIPSSHNVRYTTLLALLCLLAAACGPQPSPASPSATEIVRVIADTPTPPAPAQPLPTDTPLPATDVPTPAQTATAASTPTPLPVHTQEPTVEPVEGGAATTDDYVLPEAEITAIEAAISQEPWRFENYHYLHRARLEQAARGPVDDLDAKIAQYDQLLQVDSTEAALYVKRGEAKYQRTLLSGEPANSEDLLGDNESVTV